MKINKDFQRWYNNYVKILGTGLSGLVGSSVVELLKEGYEFEISDTDITDRNAIIEKIKSSDAAIVLHVAAKTGIFHVVGIEFVSPYKAARKIAKIFGFDRFRRGFDHNNITKITISLYFRNRATRPFHLALKNDKIQSLGVKMRSFEEGLEEVKRQMRE